MVVATLSAEMEKIFRTFGLASAGFDVLATLRRSGEPYTLLPKDLIASTMVTSGTMTNRIDQLEKAGLIARIANEHDKRSCLITLTDEGFAVIEQALEQHVATQNKLLATLSDADSEELNGLLRDDFVKLSCKLCRLPNTAR